MKNKYFSNLENKYYYGISRTFWHISAVIAVIGFIVGIVIIGWSYLPPSKKEVFKAPIPEKTAYPPQASVQISEILNALPKDKLKIEEIKNNSNNNTPEVKQEVKQHARDTTGLSNFENSISNLKNLIPFKDFSTLWRGNGYYIYPRGEAIYKVKKLEEHREFVTTSPGLLEQIEERTDSNEFKSYEEKAELVEKYNKILGVFNKSNRDEIIISLIRFKNRDYKKTISSLNSLYNILQFYGKDKLVSAFENNISFLLFNKNDGIPLLKFETEILNNFSKTERFSASNIIKAEYTNYYNNNIGGIRENTLNFIPFLKKIDTVKQSIALNFYYEIYKSKNGNRRQQIQQIDNDYRKLIRQIDADFNASKIEAEEAFQGKKQNKFTWRSDSLKIIGIALGTILLITLILLLLSMIRNVNKLAQAMLENNKSN